MLKNKLIEKKEYMLILRFNLGYISVASICDKIYEDEVLFIQKTTEFQLGIAVKVKIEKIKIINDKTIGINL